MIVFDFHKAKALKKAGPSVIFFSIAFLVVLMGKRVSAWERVGIRENELNKM